MKVKKVKNGYYVGSYVCGCHFGKVYYGYSRNQALQIHTRMANKAKRYNSAWIDEPQFSEYY